MVYSYDRTARRENSAQQAIWHAWDTFSGVDKIPERESWTRVLDNYSGGLIIGDDEAVERAGYQMDRRIQTLERQGRSWMSAYNLWLEGKITDESLDRNRLKRDLGKTKMGIETIRKAIVKTKAHAAGADNLTGWGSYTEALEASDRAIDAFGAAISEI